RMDDFIARMNRTREDIDIDSETAREEVLDRLIQYAIMRGASDIHIVPRLKSYSVFFRLLGVRHIVHAGSLEEYLTLVAQCKDRSRMDMAEKRIPQDAGFQIEHENKLVDMRVATIPGADGETVVIRILDPDRVRPQLEELGIT